MCRLAMRGFGLQFALLQRVGEQLESFTNSSTHWESLPWGGGGVSGDTQQIHPTSSQA